MHEVECNGAQLILATVLFGMQIYCDFSGYTDIAIGCARTLGFDLMQNFRRPYLATSPTDFWRRWHISLTSWFRDYVFLPLAMSKRKPSRVVIALVATFLISGLWHGANWTFVAWGGAHALLILIEQVVRRVFPAAEGSRAQGGPNTIPTRLAAIILTYLGVTLTFVFFRADSLGSALYILTHLFSGFTLQGISCHLYREYLLISLALVVFVMGVDVYEEWKGKRSDASIWELVPVPVRWFGYWSLTTCTLVLGQFSGTQRFIYFQF